jgi:hypothetical protein
MLRQKTQEFDAGITGPADDTYFDHGTSGSGPG